MPAIVHGVHGAPFHPYQSARLCEFFRWCERWAARRCHAFISVADAMTDLMVKAGVAPAKNSPPSIAAWKRVHFLIGRRASAAQFAASWATTTPHCRRQDRRLFHLKGHDDVTAAAQVVQRHPQVRFLLVGDGLFAERSATISSEAGLESYFQFTGLVPPERFPS